MRDSTSQNIQKLKDSGLYFVGPEIGDMACGEFGEGKMTEPENITIYLDSYFKNLNNNKKFKALVTAGPTRELIDPVRFISNKSSGKQGYEIAKSLKDNGFDTTIISGPTNLKDLEGINIIKVNTAEEMLNQTIKNLPVDVAIFSAAVADWKINEVKKEKIKKEENLNLNFERNVDILSNVSKHNSLRPKIVIGFSAETNNLIKNSKEKLVKKNCDWIVANDVSDPSVGFESDFNEITIFYKNKNPEKISKMKKSHIANILVEKVISELN